MRDVAFLGEGSGFVGIAAPDGLKRGVGDGGEALGEAGCGATGSEDAEADRLRLFCFQPHPPYSVNNLLVIIDLWRGLRYKHLISKELLAEYRF